LSHAEVALRLRQPLGTVKSWVRRALMSLKGCLEGSDSSRGPNARGHKNSDASGHANGA
jgi:hypothetical protein